MSTKTFKARRNRLGSRQQSTGTHVTHSGKSAGEAGTGADETQSRAWANEEIDSRTDAEWRNALKLTSYPAGAFVIDPTTRLPVTRINAGNENVWTPGSWAPFTGTVTGVSDSLYYGSLTQMDTGFVEQENGDDIIINALPMIGARFERVTNVWTYRDQNQVVANLATKLTTAQIALVAARLTGVQTYAYKVFGGSEFVIDSAGDETEYPSGAIGQPTTVTNKGNNTDGFGLVENPSASNYTVKRLRAMGPDTVAIEDTNHVRFGCKYNIENPAAAALIELDFAASSRHNVPVTQTTTIRIADTPAITATPGQAFVFDIFNASGADQNITFDATQFFWDEDNIPSSVVDGRRMEISGKAIVNAAGDTVLNARVSGDFAA